MPRFGGTVALPSGAWHMSVIGTTKGRAVNVPVRFAHPALAGLDESPVEIAGRTTGWCPPGSTCRCSSSPRGSPTTRRARRATGRCAACSTRPSAPASWRRDRVRLLRRPVVRRQPARDLRGAAAPRRRPRAHLGGAGRRVHAAGLGRARARPRDHPAGGARGRPRALRGARPGPLHRDQLAAAALVPRPRRPGGGADLARHPAQAHRQRPAAHVPRAAAAGVAPAGRRGAQLGPAGRAEPVGGAILRRAFGYEGEVLECGLPRNDLLAAGDRDGARRGDPAAARRARGQADRAVRADRRGTTTARTARCGSTSPSCAGRSATTTCCWCAATRCRPTRRRPGLAAPDSAAAQGDGRRRRCRSPRRARGGPAEPEAARPARRGGEGQGEGEGRRLRRARRSPSTSPPIRTSPSCCWWRTC